MTQLPPSPTLPSQNPALPRRGFSFFVELKGMPDYWVFQDKLFKRACIHRSNCSVRKGAISPGPEGTWHGAYTTYEEARRTAAELSPKKGAQLIAAFATRKTSKTTGAPALTQRSPPVRSGWILATHLARRA